MSCKQFWDDEWPNLNSISVALFCPMLTPTELGILYRLVWAVASGSVHSAYTSAKGPLIIPRNDERICLLAGCTRSEWDSASKAVLEYFREEKDGYHLIDDGAIRISRPGRKALSTVVARAAVTRDGTACVYSGDTAGPFHMDHLWPVSKGGTDDTSNIVTACASCNLSKGAKTLREWMLT